MPRKKRFCVVELLYIYDQLLARLGYTHTYVCIGRVRSFFFLIEKDNIILPNLFKKTKKKQRNGEWGVEGWGRRHETKPLKGEYVCT